MIGNNLLSVDNVGVVLFLNETMKRCKHTNRKANREKEDSIDLKSKQEQIDLDFYSKVNTKKIDSISAIASIIVEIITLGITGIEIGSDVVSRLEE